jgi:hypothetical protein
MGISRGRVRAAQLLACLALSLSSLIPERVAAEGVRIYKVVCLRSEEGCPCLASPGGSEVRGRLFHAVAVTSSSEDSNGYRRIEVEGRGCFYPSDRLIPMKSPGVLSSPRQRLVHRLLPLHEFFENGDADARKLQSGRIRYESIGYFWPTYYHLALEELYPGRQTNIIDPRGRVIGRASDEFLRQVTWEGSGFMNDGRHLRYGGREGRYEFYESDIWGYGAGFGYTIYPYRTIAVNFPGLCRRLAKWIKGCSKEEAIGVVVRMEGVESKRVGMEGGEIHDGLFCATDTGAPYFIREDRIDIFVGMHGGGNPYLPPERRGNRLIEGGILNILPSEWRLWNDVNDRVWCDVNRIPVDPFHPRRGECAHDYHSVAANKALRLSVLFDENDRPVRCKKRLPFKGGQ